MGFLIGYWISSGTPALGKQLPYMCLQSGQVLIINSQGCEVLGQEKSRLFEQHLNAAEPNS